MAWRQLFIKVQRPNALAVQAHNLVVEVAEHAFDLMIAALNDTQPGTTWAKQVQLGWLGGQVFKCEINTLFERDGIRVGYHILCFDVLHLGLLGFGLRHLT